MRKLSLILSAIVVTLTIPQLQSEDAPSKVNFAEHIAPLVFKNCTSCHRPGEAAPFSLQSYKDVRRHAKTMLNAMEEKYMPPWQLEPGHGEFRDARILSDDQIKLFKQWVKEGMPEGDSTKT